LYAAAGFKGPWLGHPAPARRLEASTTTGHGNSAAAYCHPEKGPVAKRHRKSDLYSDSADACFSALR
jgi:hypothetical protein